jgi:hypothetical protein
MGAFITDTNPEDVAERLRNVKVTGTEPREPW